jgi:hypothetical protein
MACATFVYRQYAACVTSWFCLCVLFVGLQLLIPDVDPMLGSDGTVHEMDLTWSLTLTPSLSLNYLGFTICAAHTVVYKVSYVRFSTN